jgi:hypothetical protein
VSTRTEFVKDDIVQNSTLPAGGSGFAALFTNCKLAFSLPCLFAHIKAVHISSELNGAGTIELNIQN